MSISNESESANIFSKIYNDSYWGKGSGDGSDPKKVVKYISLIEDFIKRNKLNSVVDLGCGDWQFSNLIKFNNINYLGIDVVESVVENNNKKYSTDNITFEKLKSYNEIPKADLLLVKDVLQHLPQEEVKKIIDNLFSNYKFIIVTNCISPFNSLGNLILKFITKKKIYNRKINFGEFTYFDIRKSPYNLKGKILLIWKYKRYSSKRGIKSLPQILKRLFFGKDCIWKKNSILITN